METSCILKLQKKSIFVCLNIENELKKMIFSLTWVYTFACLFVSPIHKFSMSRMLNSLYPIILDQWGLVYTNKYAIKILCTWKPCSTSVFLCDPIPIPLRRRLSGWGIGATVIAQLKLINNTLFKILKYIYFSPISQIRPTLKFQNFLKNIII